MTEAIRRRRMVRSFTGEPVEAELLRRLLDQARRAPTAGHTQGVAFVTLVGPDETARYWDLTLPRGPERAAFRWQGLLAAPVLVVVAASPGAYVERYAEPDKVGTGLGRDPDDWPVPYWHVDAGMAVMALLLGAVDAGLGASFFGLFAHEVPVLAALGVPDGWRGVGTVALGHPGPASDHPGRSASRSRKLLDEVVHPGRW